MTFLLIIQISAKSYDSSDSIEIYADITSLPDSKEISFRGDAINPNDEIIYDSSSDESGVEMKKIVKREVNDQQRNKRALVFR